jgi:hypothetical protein
MAAPIVLEVVANPPPDADLVRAVVDGCVAAATPRGCVLAAEGADGESGAEATRVIVSFGAGGARVHIEVLAPVAGAGAGAGAVARDVSFRAEDPLVERYRAAGLVAAGLASDLAAVAPVASTAEASLADPATATLPERSRLEALLRLGGRIGWNDGRPWVGAELGTDFAVAGPAFVALSGSYAETWTRDAAGVGEQRAAIGAGAGVAASLIRHRLELRVRVEIDLEQVRASVVQPSTGRQDAGSRTLVGAESGAELVMPFGTTFGAFAGGRLAWWGSDTTVRVQGMPTDTIRAWSESIVAGFDVRLP